MLRLVLQALCLLWMSTACGPSGLLDPASTSGEILAQGSGFEAESMSGSQSITSLSTASGGKYRKYWRAGAATFSAQVSSPSAGFSVRASADLCAGSPTLVVKLDGTQVLSTSVSQTSWTSFRVDVPLTVGVHLFEVTFPNDYYGGTGCDRNLNVDVITFSPGTACVPTTCSAQGKSCGSIPDGCGGTVACGSCGTDQTCTSNVCVANLSGRQVPCGTSMATISSAINGSSAGQAVLLQRGCTYTGTLTITASHVILGAYGSGNRPIITGGAGITVQGTNVTLEDLHVDNPSRPNSSGDRGVGLTLNGDGTVVRRSAFSRGYSGIEINESSEGNSITLCDIYDNTKMQTPSGSDDDNGAFGILIHGHRNDVGYNRFWGMDAPSPDYNRDGSAIEIYGGSYNELHHNLAWNCDAFTELGKSGTTDNRYTYNSFYSTTNGRYAAFVVTRGASNFGPVKNTLLLNNSAMVVGASGQGIVCYGGCDSTIMTARNNAVMSTRSQLYCDSNCIKSNNLTSSSASSLFSVSIRQDGAPLLRLKSGSAGIDTGVTWFTDRRSCSGTAPDPACLDVEGHNSLVDGDRSGSAVIDVGAYEMP
jgi:hypothetical protein